MHAQQNTEFIKILLEFYFYRRYRKEGAKTTLREKQRDTEKALISGLMSVHQVQSCILTSQPGNSFPSVLLYLQVTQH